MSERRKTLGLVLGAGGARGACHVGVIKMFEQNGIPIDYIAGSSMGLLLVRVILLACLSKKWNKRLQNLK